MIRTPLDAVFPDMPPMPNPDRVLRDWGAMLIAAGIAANPALAEVSNTSIAQSAVYLADAVLLALEES